MSDKARPLTLDQLIAALLQLRESYPKYAECPVHMLDMEDSPEGGALVTHVEVDKFSDDEGWVVSLMSWPGEPGK